MPPSTYAVPSGATAMNSACNPRTCAPTREIFGAALATAEMPSSSTGNSTATPAARTRWPIIMDAFPLAVVNGKTLMRRSVGSRPGGGDMIRQQEGRGRQGREAGPLGELGDVRRDRRRAAAALAGVLFVAVSIRIDFIARSQELRN